MKAHASLWNFAVCPIEEVPFIISLLVNSLKTTHYAFKLHSVTKHVPVKYLQSFSKFYCMGWFQESVNTFEILVQFSFNINVFFKKSQAFVSVN